MSLTFELLKPVVSIQLFISLMVDKTAIVSVFLLYCFSFERVDTVLLVTDNEAVMRETYRQLNVNPLE